jgi:hypothetical protein
LSHLYFNANILPRQARDKHRENSKKGPFFLCREELRQAILHRKKVFEDADEDGSGFLDIEEIAHVCRALALLVVVALRSLCSALRCAALHCWAMRCACCQGKHRPVSILSHSRAQREAQTARNYSN